MKAHDMACKAENAQTQVGERRQHGPNSYRKVYDERKRRIRGLWKRNDAFYVQMAIEDPATGQKVVRRTRLEDQDGNPVATVAGAVKAMQRLKVRREDNKLTLDPKRTPTFQEYSARYLEYFEQVKDAKRPATVRVEAVCVRRWNEFLGAVRLRQIGKPLVNAYIAKRQGEGVSGRTVNLELVVLRNILRKAIDDGYLSALPIEGIKWLKYHPEKRRLVTYAEIEKLCNTALPGTRNGQEFADFVWLMAFSGGRWGETLRLRWQDVDSERKQLVFGADGLSKNGQTRVVDFNAKLEAHLQAMVGRKAPDSIYLFPSPKRGEGDSAATTFNMALRKVRQVAGVLDFTFHLCRHYFISTAVMAGVDYMTIAKWVGHQDGGVLIGKVYGHLNSEHARQQAAKLAF